LSRRQSRNRNSPSTALVICLALVGSARAEEACLPAPKGGTPTGSHWHYHTDPITHAKCWRLVTDEQSSQIARRPRSEPSSTPNAPQSPISRDPQLQANGPSVIQNAPNDGDLNSSAVSNTAFPLTITGADTSPSDVTSGAPTAPIPWLNLSPTTTGDSTWPSVRSTGTNNSDATEPEPDAGRSVPMPTSGNGPRAAQLSPRPKSNHPAQATTTEQNASSAVGDKEPTLERERDDSQPVLLQKSDRRFSRTGNVLRLAGAFSPRDLLLGLLFVTAIGILVAGFAALRIVQRIARYQTMRYSTTIGASRTRSH
jgi:hypothetical protein